MSSPHPTDDDLAVLRSAVLAWYRRAHRNFPWRRTRDPYAILVSEVMLQQTQAARVVPRFERFLARFPTPDALAAASPAAVLAEWSGLGYNRRALALQRTARAVAEGGWPRDLAALERLPGVGPYTARALASLAFGQRVGVVDTNVRRWLLRRLPGRAANRPAALQRLADQLAAVGTSDPRWIHASMEFGAAICTARRARCDDCPVAVGCPARHAPPPVATARQAPYPGSRRAARGALLRLLVAAPDHALSIGAAREALSATGFGGNTAPPLIDSMARDGLLHRAGDRLIAGPATVGAVRRRRGGYNR